VGFAHWRFQPGKDSLVFAVKGSFRLEQGGRAQPLAEPDAITGDEFAGDEPDLGACRYASDIVPFKPKSDALLVGKVHAPSTRPGGAPATQCNVSFAVAGVSLTLRVTGDRYWLSDTRASEPKPFSEMDLGYERAFGGAGWAANPAGKGAPGPASLEPSPRPLPNIEDPAELVKTVADLPPPAGFGPLAPHWGHRMAKWPAVTQSTIEERWPWAPAELDYSYFNAAQPALQLAGYFRGDETLSCENLHREHRKYTSRLPGLRPRCFVLDKEGDKDRFREVALRLDTLWVDMTSEKLALVWRGSIPVATMEFDEVEYVYVAVEELDAPRLALEQHRQVFELARSEAEAAKRSPDPSEACANDNEAAISLPVAVALPAVRPARRAEALPADLRKKLEAMGTPADVLDAVERGDMAGAQAITRNKLGVSEAELERNTAQMTERMKKAHADSGGDPSAFDPPKPPPAATPAAPREGKAWTRAKLEAALAAGTSLAGADLSGLDLTGLDLRGRDLSGSLLCGAQLAGAKLDGANLDGSNLSGALADGVSFREASFEQADLTGLFAPGAAFSGAKLVGALLDSAELTGAKLDSCQAAGASLRKAKLADVDCSAADFSGALFAGACIDRARFCGALLDGAIAEGVVGEGVDFRKASMVGFRAGEGSSLIGAKLSGCKAGRSRWMGADLSGADMTRADLSSSDLSRTTLRDARLSGADCQRADFTKANLGHADLSGANLSAAQLEAADLRFANLRGACLYQAQLWRAQLSDARLDGAFTAGTLLQSPVRGWAR